MFADGRIVSILKTFTWRKARALENFNHYFGIASLSIFFLTLVLGVCVRFKLKTIYISKR